MPRMLLECWRSLPGCGIRPRAADSASGPGYSDTSGTPVLAVPRPSGTSAPQSGTQRCCPALRDPAPHGALCATTPHGTLPRPPTAHCLPRPRLSRIRQRGQRAVQPLRSSSRMHRSRTCTHPSVSGAHFDSHLTTTGIPASTGRRTAAASGLVLSPSRAALFPEAGAALVLVPADVPADVPACPHVARADVPSLPLHVASHVPEASDAPSLAPSLTPSPSRPPLFPPPSRALPAPSHSIPLDFLALTVPCTFVTLHK